LKEEHQTPDLHQAFKQAVSEYNDFGLAKENVKYQITEEECSNMYGFKVSGQNN